MKLFLPWALLLTTVFQLDLIHAAAEMTSSGADDQDAHYQSLRVDGSALADKKMKEPGDKCTACEKLDCFNVCAPSSAPSESVAPSMAPSKSPSFHPTPMPVEPPTCPTDGSIPPSHCPSPSIAPPPPTTAPTRHRILNAICCPTETLKLPPAARSRKIEAPTPAPTLANICCRKLQEAPTPSPTQTPPPVSTPTGTVKGTVFDDLNDNGIQDPGEPGIPGVDVVITTIYGTTFTLTTNTMGMYMAEVPVGPTETNIVEGTLPPGVIQTAGNDPTTLIVTAGGTATDLDGFYNPAPTPWCSSPIRVKVDFDTYVWRGELHPLPDQFELTGDQWKAYGLYVLKSDRNQCPYLYDTRYTTVGPAFRAPNEACTPAGPGVGFGGFLGACGENCDPLGNVLMVHDPSEEPPYSVDKADTITFDFVPDAVKVYEIGFLNAQCVDVEVVYGGGQEERHIIPNLGDNAVQTVAIDKGDVSEIRVNLGRTGAITFLDFEYCSDTTSPLAPTPTPAPYFCAPQPP